jgi:transposase
MEQEEALGRSRGGFSTKVHMRAEGQGKPLVFVLTGGERHEQTAFESLMEHGAVRRVGRGRPRIRPERLVGDKAYSTDKVRGYLRRREVDAVIPYRAGQRTSDPFDRRTYRERNRIERLINRLKQFRRIATRYEKRAANYLAMLAVATILLWL